MKTSQANMYVDINGAWRVVEGVQLKQILVIMKVGHKQLTAKKKNTCVHDAGLSLRVNGQGFLSATMSMTRLLSYM